MILDVQRFFQATVGSLRKKGFCVCRSPSFQRVNDQEVTNTNKVLGISGWTGCEDNIQGKIYLGILRVLQKLPSGIEVCEKLQNIRLERHNGMYMVLMLICQRIYYNIIKLHRKLSQISQLVVSMFIFFPPMVIIVIRSAQIHVLLFYMFFLG